MNSNEHKNHDSQAQIVLHTKDINEDMDYFISIGFRLINIFPDDSPEVAVMTGHGINIRLDKNANQTPVTIHILTDNPEQFDKQNTELIAPNGTLIKVLPKSSGMLNAFKKLVDPKTKFAIPPLAADCQLS